MNVKKITRRQFLQGTSALAGAALVTGSRLGTLIAETKIPTAADVVPLGRTGLIISRVGIGTGSSNGNIQRGLGRDGFNKLVHYAYDRGIRYIDTAENYRTHDWVRDAIKGLPREKLFIQTKMWKDYEDPLRAIDRYRQEIGVDYIDSLLIHCRVEPNWDEKHQRLMDRFSEAKEKKIILSHGVSCHSMPALVKASHMDWVDVNLVRVNPQGAHIDTPAIEVSAPSNPSHLPSVLEEMKVMRQKGHGIIGMKIIGDGDFTNPADREKSIRYAMQPGLVDAIVIGFKSEAEIDEAITRIDNALKHYATAASSK
jgi:predicted aldo/keto reductase-like oxidoreductase